MTLMPSKNSLTALDRLSVNESKTRRMLKDAELIFD